MKHLIIGWYESPPLWRIISAPLLIAFIPFILFMASPFILIGAAGAAIKMTAELLYNLWNEPLEELFP
jgi:hypothetical protein